jgi:hypothetical protein
VTTTTDDPLEALYYESYPTLRWVVRCAGIAEEDREDAAATLFLQFIEWGGLEKYDPYRMHDAGASPDIPGDRYRRAKLNTFMRAWAKKAVLSLRDKQEVRHRRVPWRLDTPLTHTSESEYMVTTWGEHEAYAVDPIDRVETQMTLQVAVTNTCDILITKTTKFRDYARFCDLYFGALYLDGTVDRRSLAIEMGVCKSVLDEMIAEVRRTMSDQLAGSGLRPEAEAS